MNVEQNKTGMIGNHKEWELEAMLDGNEVSAWLTNNFNISLTCAALYVTGVFAGKKYMENQAKFSLRQPMMFWSLFLAVFSIIGSIRSVLVLYYIGHKEGLYGLVCSNNMYVLPIIRFWGPVFVFSKILEYMDTVFIILRKQRLIFLHWYHHLTVSLFSWVVYASQCAGGGIFMTANFIVHSLMYSYYALRAAGVKIPKPIAIVITSSQIVQMVIGSIAVYLAHLWRQEGMCKAPYEVVVAGGLMYASYFVLFVHFFYVTYLRKRPIRNPKESAEPESSKIDESKDRIRNGSSSYNLRERKNGGTEYKKVQ